jgi:hypothetical protein
MWVPKDLQDFTEAVENGLLEEKHDFDAKRELPGSGKELAKDIAAMTTDGGSLVYGVAEDDSGQPRVLAPIELSGAAERIDQIAQTSISGTPKVEFVHLRLPDDSGRGYLVVVIPASPEAPHQVTVGDDRRFYGRCDTGNRRLSEEEIARLYERRNAQAVDREELLRDCIARSPFSLPQEGEHGFLQAFVQPVPLDDDLWDKAVASRGGEQILLKELRDAVVSAATTRWGGTNLTNALDWRRIGADTWSLDRSTTFGQEDDPRRAVRADFNMNGRGYLFYGSAADRDAHSGGEPVFVLHERGIALTLAQFLGLAGALYQAADFHGQVDVGMAVTGIQGAISAHSVGDRFFQASPYGEQDATRTERCDARELRDQPRAVSLRLLSRLLRASFGSAFDPLED